MPVNAPGSECLSRDELKHLQDQRLCSLISRVYEKVIPYRDKMKQAGLAPADIRGIDDLNLLPFTVKQDLRDHYPFGLFAVPTEEIVRIHASSGTTGKQTVVAYTQKDVDLWSELMARAFASIGATRNDFIHVAYGYGLFTGGLGAHYGAEKLGATVIPVSTGNTKRQVQIIQDFGSTVICCTPSYALYLAETFQELGIAPGSLKLKAGLFGAEPWTESMRREIEERLRIKAYDIYGLSEIIGPGVACECEAQDGMHVCEDHFIPEIIDPATGKILPHGESGELVFTCLTKEALPLVRYRTRDITSLSTEKCSCGRTLVRMKKPTGRSDDMLIIRGVNVFPSQVESVLLEMKFSSPHYLICVDRVNNLDVMEIQVEMLEANFSDEVRRLEELERRMAAAIESTLGIAAKIRLVEPRTLQRSEGKAKRVIDKRGDVWGKN